MPDKFGKEVRSKIMSAIKSKGTKPELILKKKLRGKGYVYQPKINGSPDLANKKKRMALFVDGCFWHACKSCYKQPKSNKSFWAKKIERNISRDKRTSRRLRKEGWKVIRLWEHQILKKADRCLDRIERASGEINYK